MISIFCPGTVKAARLGEWPEVLHWLVETTLAEDTGCLRYAWYGPVPNPDDPQGPYSREYILHEQWRDEESLLAHVARLQGRFGPPAPGAPLPARFLDFFERFEANFYELRGSNLLVGVSTSEASS